jgi:hypothetical protein
MEKSSRLLKVLRYQNLGFLAIIVLCYLDDLLQLPKLIFSEHPFLSLYRRSTLEMLLVLAVWFLVSTSTRRVLERIRYLEKFMRVCAWCRRIEYKGRWVLWEEFIKEGFDTPTSHGICSDCFQVQQKAIERPRKTPETEPSTGNA